MTTSIRFSDEEMIAISAAADRKQTSRHEFMRNAILASANPTTVPTPSTPAKPPADAKPAPTATSSRKSQGVNMGNLGNFYGS